jgi:hypothetical protein
LQSHRVVNRNERGPGGGGYFRQNYRKLLI